MGFQVRGLQRGELDAALGCFQAAFAIDDASIAVVRNSLVNGICLLFIHTSMIFQFSPSAKITPLEISLGRLY